MCPFSLSRACDVTIPLPHPVEKLLLAFYPKLSLLLFFLCPIGSSLVLERRDTGLKIAHVCAHTYTHAQIKFFSSQQ
jgi:hypothetical protein